MFDTPATREAALWASRLLHLREPPPARGQPAGAAATLREVRRALLRAPAPSPDPAVAARPVGREAAVWAYRIFLGRDPESEAVVAACVGLRDIAQLSANFRREPEHIRTLEPEDTSETSVEILGAPTRVVGFAHDEYFRGVPTLGPALADLAAVARAVARVRPGRFQALDAGACLGLTAVTLARALPGHRVVAVEPSPMLAGLARRNLAANAPEVELENVAVGAREGGRAPFREEVFSAGSHLLTPADAATATHWVEQTTLDALAERLGLDDLGFVKLDIEGFERDALEGGLATLRRCRPVVHLEFNAWAQLAMSDSNPRHFLEWMLGTFPHLHALRPEGGGAARWRRVDSWQSALHRNIVDVGGVEDLVLSFDDSWAAALA